MHPNYSTLKTKVTFRKQLSWLCSLSEIRPNAILGNDKSRLLNSEISHPMEKIGSILDFVLDKEEQEGHCYAKFVFFFNDLVASRNNVSFYLLGPTQTGL